MMQNRLTTAQETQKALRSQLDELRAAVERRSTAAQDQRIQDLDQEHAKLENELAAYSAYDPAKVEEKRRAVMLAREAAVRWTDNYVMLLSYFTRQNGIEAADVRTYLGVDEEYEDIEG
ncbi:hypothetical protein BN946_scf184855.g16 [Trametes cinnabarina]|uniref:Leucine zipper with capping helix domain-containing protein n=1 Tax=Pycnoporus cinnabarinus TaxID=5643 RepID=A0A060SSI7_PYCCI|nr:hypothetical protein BN946_scf184855.g16 [Trametes cinnabarina]